MIKHVEKSGFRKCDVMGSIIRALKDDLIKEGLLELIYYIPRIVHSFFLFFLFFYILCIL